MASISSLNWPMLNQQRAVWAAWTTANSVGFGLPAALLGSWVSPIDIPDMLLILAGCIASTVLGQWVVLWQQRVRANPVAWILISWLSFAAGVAAIALVGGFCILVSVAGASVGGDYVPYGVSNLLRLFVGPYVLVCWLFGWGTLAYSQWTVLQRSTQSLQRRAWLSAYLAGGGLVGIGTLVLVANQARHVGGGSAGPVYFLDLGTLLLLIFGLVAGGLIGILTGLVLIPALATEQQPTG